jgi:hypothetical protein
MHDRDRRQLPGLIAGQPHWWCLLRSPAAHILDQPVQGTAPLCTLVKPITDALGLSLGLGYPLLEFAHGGVESSLNVLRAMTADAGHDLLPGMGAGKGRSRGAPLRSLGSEPLQLVAGSRPALVGGL